MPYVNISLTRGKSRKYLQGVSDAASTAATRRIRIGHRGP